MAYNFATPRSRVVRRCVIASRVTPRDFSISRCLPVVVLEHAPEPFLAPNLAQRFGAFSCDLRFPARRDRHIAESLVRPDRVEILHIGTDDLIQLSQAEAEEVVEALF